MRCGRFALLSSLVLAVAIPKCASDADQGAEFQTVPLSDFICDQFNWDEPRSTPSILLEIPKQYKKTPAPFNVACVWATEADAERMFKPETPSLEDGCFKIQLSRSAGFDAHRNIFTSGMDHDETDLADVLRTEGIRDVTVERHNVRGRPALVVEGILPSGQPSTLVYLAMRIGTNVVTISYVPRKERSEWDDKVWTRFKRSLLAGIPGTSYVTPRA